MQKYALLVGSVLGLAAISPQAHAQIPVTDIGSHVLSQLGIANQVTEIGKMVAQLEQLQQTYTMIRSQYQAIAHLPQDIAGMASGLEGPTLTNPLPGLSQIEGLVNGVARPTGYGSQYLANNTYYTPTGDDPGSLELLRRQMATAGLQGMATDALKSLDQRAASLHEFLSEIGSSPDIQQTSAIQARLQLEQNYVAGQQAQAANLLALAQTQAAVDQNRAQEIALKDAQDWKAKTDGVWGQMP